MNRDLRTLCRVVVLEDNDVVHLRKGAYGIFNALLKEKERHRAVPRALETLNMEVSQIMKGGYDTFMQVKTSFTPHSPPTRTFHPSLNKPWSCTQYCCHGHVTRCGGYHCVPVVQ